VQNALVRALEKQHLWQRGTDLRAWLFTLLHNLYVNEVRQAMRVGIAVGIEDVASSLPVASNAGAVLELRELEAAIARLPDVQRQVLLLVGLEGFGYEEVARILSIPIGTVRSRISRGRDNLRRMLGMEDGEVWSAAA
jgi:RNA polymerase sigma-70 factor (ECF subfamily)